METKHGEGAQVDVTAAEATLPLQKVKATLPNILEKYQREFTMLIKQRYFIVKPQMGV